ncbi:MAG: urease accessory protein UreF [Burkholderiales bacterium]
MNISLLRLLQLASPALPVGAYTYSQGLEWAVESGAVKNETDALAWIGDCLEFGVGRFEAVYLAHMLAAWRGGDEAALAGLDAEFLASRESAELRAETVQMGYSLARLLADLPDFPAQRLAAFAEPSFPLAWSCAVAEWAIAAEDAVAAYLWAWAENQAMAALKSVPLGQTAGQRLLLGLGQRIAALAGEIAAAPLDSTHNYLPAFAIASSRHETQYTRIFRS